MVKIGIITFQRTIGNYGASLQCFALYNYLVAQGYYCEVIDLLRKEHDNYIESDKYKWPLKKRSLLRRIASFVKWQIFRKFKKQNAKINYNSKRIERFDKFNNMIKYSKQYRSIDLLYENPPIYDIYLTGSDQVWNPTIGFYNEPYFLTFAPKYARKVSYASSIALPSLPVEYHQLYKKWLSNYYKVSVREKEGKSIIENLINQDVSIVLDPTFLIDTCKWQEWAISPKLDNKYLFIYTLVYNKQLIEFAHKKAKMMGLDTIIAMSTTTDVAFEKDIVFVDNLGPLEWIGFIKDADCFITDSFHGTVFSIMLGTPFYVYISLAIRGSRIKNLLDTFSLSDHCLTSDFNEISKMTFDYNKTLEIIEEKKTQSKSFLHSAITGENN